MLKTLTLALVVSLASFTFSTAFSVARASDKDADNAPDKQELYEGFLRNGHNALESYDDTDVHDAQEAQAALKAILTVLDVDDRPPVSSRRESLLLLVDMWSAKAAPAQLAKNHAQFQKLTDTLLERFAKRPSTADHVIRIKTRLHLWSTANWWFFKEPRKLPNFLEEHREIIYQLLPQLSTDQRREYSETLDYISPPRRETQLALQYELRGLEVSDMVAWFKLASERYAQRIERLSGQSMLSRQQFKSQEEADTFFRAPLMKVLAAVRAEEPAASQGYYRAISYTMGKQPEKANQLKFFRAADKGPAREDAFFYDCETQLHTRH